MAKKSTKPGKVDPKDKKAVAKKAKEFDKTTAKKDDLPKARKMDALEQRQPSDASLGALDKVKVKNSAVTDRPGAYEGTETEPAA